MLPTVYWHQQSDQRAKKCPAKETEESAILHGGGQVYETSGSFSVSPKRQKSLGSNLEGKKVTLSTNFHLVSREMRKHLTPKFINNTYHRLLLRVNWVLNAN